MTKKEMAIRVATRMKEIKTDINIERTTKKLMAGMTTHELEVLIKEEEKKI